MKRIDADVEAELKRELASAPLMRKGFTNDLRRRIEQRIDENAAYPRSRYPLAGSLLSFIVVFAAFAGVLLFNLHADQTAMTEESETTMQQTFEPPAFGDNADQASFVSGLLIGLRTDDKDISYRTLYIAPRKGQPAVVAQGSGILVPYKRDFWKIEPLRYETVTDRYEFFVSHPAAERAAEGRRVGPGLFRDDPDEKVIHSEKILFAANEYVSIGQTNEVVSGGVSSSSSRVWTTTIPSLAAKRAPVTLNDVLQTRLTTSEYTTDQWFVSRNQGRWVAMTAYSPYQTAKGESETHPNYRQLDVQLPRSVVNHDEPCCSWSDIGARFPDVIDTFSSPAKDMTVVSTDGLLLVFGSPSQLSGEPALSIKLKTRESVVMAQWATEHYVEEWALKTAELLR